MAIKIDRAASKEHFVRCMPDETTILKVRHLLEQKGLGKVLFKEVNKRLEKNGLMLREGSIMDVTIISTPSSTKNKTGQRDPERHQTKTGNEWHLGMRIHIGVNDTLGLIHSNDTIAGKVHDFMPTGKLLHGEDIRVFGDAGYLGIQKRDEHKHRKRVSWFIAKRPGARKKLDADKLTAEKIKDSVRAKVEHPFRYIKHVFGYSKARYRGLGKNSNRLHLLAAFSNLLMGENHLLA